MPKYLFPTGAATPTGAYLVIQVMQDNDQVIPGNLLADYRFAPNPDVFGIDWSALSICHHESEDAVYALGGNGEVVRIMDAGNRAELIDPPEDGPSSQGPLREVRSIGKDLFALGMGRQIYRRVRDARWDRADHGVLDATGRATIGLTSIAGDGLGFLVTVGYEGEIWEFGNAWELVDSPTNVLLTRVTQHAGTFYAGGLLGTLLCRGTNGWRIIPAPDFTHDIWDLETFRGTLFIGTPAGLHRLTSTESIEPVSPSSHAGARFTSLSARTDRLWAFGGEVVLSTVDGVSWREEAIL